MNLNTDVNITGVAGAAANTSTLVTGAIDTAGYDGVMVIVRCNVANAGNYIKAGQDSAVGLGTIADIKGSKVVCTVGDQFLFIDIFRPTKRYVQVSLARGSSSAAGDFVIVRYGGRVKAENNVKTGYKGVFLQSPDEGVA